mmetsp:Transcript_15877/g.36599  ORF Transcript_15877/g.36599 Transcript_15877/m.36599 type:complete len:81 (+) Transcript_15877:123-365(+)
MLMPASTTTESNNTAGTGVFGAILTPIARLLPSESRELAVMVNKKLWVTESLVVCTPGLVIDQRSTCDLAPPSKTRRGWS